MINFSELDKIVTSGKTITIVVLADSKEVFAISFDSATLAYKHIIESVAAITTAPVIKDKPDSSKASTEEKEEAPEGVDIETGEVFEEAPAVDPKIEVKPEPKKRQIAEPKTETKAETKAEPKAKEPKPEKEIKQPGTALTGDVIIDDDGEW